MNKFCFNYSVEDLPSSTIVLVSGTPSHFQHVSSTYSAFRSAFVSNNHYPKRKLPASSIAMRRLAHLDCGGPSTFISLMAYHNCGDTTPSLTSIRRSLKHFFNFGLRPDSTHQSPELTYTLGHKLNIHYLERLVSFPTHFTSSGSGYCRLTSQELGLMFGLSELFASDTSIVTYPFPPIQCLDVILHPLLSSVREHRSPQMLCVPHAPTPSHTFFPQF